MQKFVWHFSMLINIFDQKKEVLKGIIVNPSNPRALYSGTKPRGSNQGLFIWGFKAWCPTNQASFYRPQGVPPRHFWVPACLPTGGGEKMQLDPSKNAMQKNAKKAKNAKKNATSKEIPL